MNIDIKKLINSLTTGEKRNFSLMNHFPKGKKKPSYLKLYKLYQRDDFDDKKLNDKLRKTGWSETYISSSKHYLLNSIFKGLRNSYDEETMNRKITNLIFESDILEKKGFTKGQIKLLEKAKKLSSEYEYFSQAIEIIDKLRPIIAIEFPVEDSKRLLIQLRKERQEFVEASAIESSIRTYFSNCYILYRHKRGGEKIEDELKELKEQYSIFLSNMNIENFSFHAKLNHFGFNNLCHHLLGESELRKKGLSQVIQLYDHSLKFKNEFFDRYIKTISNYISNCVNLGDSDSIESILNRLNDLKPKLQRQKTELTFVNFYGRVMMHMSRKEFKSVCDLAPEAVKKLNLSSTEQRSSRRKLFFINFALAAFLSNNSKYDPIVWLNHIYNIKPNSEWEAIKIRADFLEIFSLFDSKNYEVVNTKCNRLVRQYKKLFNTQPKRATNERKNQLQLVENIREIARIFDHARITYDKKRKTTLHKKGISLINQIRNDSPLVNDWEELQFWLKKNISNNQNP